MKFEGNAVSDLTEFPTHGVNIRIGCKLIALFRLLGILAWQCWLQCWTFIAKKIWFIQFNLVTKKWAKKEHAINSKLFTKSKYCMLSSELTVMKQWNYKMAQGGVSGGKVQNWPITIYYLENRALTSSLIRGNNIS